MNTPLSIFIFGSIATSIAYSAPAPELSSAPQSSGEKTHTLFMGVDISVEKDKKFHRVRDVSRSSWIININGKPEFIPTERKALNLRVEQAVKLTHSSATLANLKSERAYSPGNDPRSRAMANQIQMAAYAMERAMAAEMALSRASLVVGSNPSQPNPLAPPPPAPTVSIDELTQDLTKATDFASGNFTGSQFHQSIAEEQLKMEKFDAIAVEFEVASQERLPNPYVIVVAQFREPTAAKETARNWIYAQSLDPLDEQPKKVRVLRGGFPPGYILEKVEVHLYDQGREIATNLSPKRVPLTQDEAFEYVVIEHIAGNKGATVPATPVMVAFPAEFWNRLSAGQGQSKYYVVVSKEGRVSEAYEDPDFSRDIADAFFADAVKKIWFKPALEKGKPVETKTMVDVTKLRL